MQLEKIFSNLVIIAAVLLPLLVSADPSVSNTRTISQGTEDVAVTYGRKVKSYEIAAAEDAVKYLMESDRKIGRDEAIKRIKADTLSMIIFSEIRRHFAKDQKITATKEETEATRDFFEKKLQAESIMFASGVLDAFRLK